MKRFLLEPRGLARMNALTPLYRNHCGTFMC